jgi:hypothetical protein
MKKDYVREALYTIAMSAVGLFGFWVFVYLLFSID